MTDDIPTAPNSSQARARKGRPSPSAVDLELFCCFVGSDTPFLVKISSSLTVDDLKEAIKQKMPNYLRRIDSARLALFEISIPDKGDLATKVKGAITEGKESLRSTTKLSQIFPNEPPEETIHIAVKLPDGAGESFAFGPIPLIHLLLLYRPHLQSNFLTT
ncbi:hypothetical protein K435DRAFT_467269 [Dendrothele bispora CBS 962.96]|uniref:Crinkler effector protein N-terminal domain-containing protein n=1 Tax=Dendrothele bispora (strain CBS 962.96) TaxID=1314807 RepID=A0A4S8L0E6_DENBC|nr:hypothetical protein K435DRAFT_467269 [Dendrothele bispora CBS 962.96]